MTVNGATKEKKKGTGEGLPDWGFRVRALPGFKRTEFRERIAVGARLRVKKMLPEIVSAAVRQVQR